LEHAQTTVNGIALCFSHIQPVTKQCKSTAVSYEIYESAKMNGTQKRTLVSLLRKHCTQCGMPKGTFRVEVTSNNKKIKLVSLNIIKLV